MLVFLFCHYCYSYHFQFRVRFIPYGMFVFSLYVNDFIFFYMIYIISYVYDSFTFCNDEEMIVWVFVAWLGTTAFGFYVSNRTILHTTVDGNTINLFCFEPKMVGWCYEIICNHNPNQFFIIVFPSGVSTLSGWN